MKMQSKSHPVLVNADPSLTLKNPLEMCLSALQKPSEKQEISKEKGFFYYLQSARHSKCWCECSQFACMLMLCHYHAAHSSRPGGQPGCEVEKKHSYRNLLQFNRPNSIWSCAMSQCQTIFKNVAFCFKIKELFWPFWKQF